jgi:hypothetical protein
MLSGFRKIGGKLFCPLSYILWRCPFRADFEVRTNAIAVTYASKLCDFCEKSHTSACEPEDAIDFIVIHIVNFIVQNPGLSDVILGLA